MTFRGATLALGAVTLYGMVLMSLVVRSPYTLLMITEIRSNLEEADAHTHTYSRTQEDKNIYIKDAAFHVYLPGSEQQRSEHQLCLLTTVASNHRSVTKQ